MGSEIEDIFLPSDQEVKKKKIRKRKAKKEKSEGNNFTESTGKNLEKLGKELIVADKKIIMQNEVGKRTELIKAAEDGYIDKKVPYLKKCGEKIIDKLYIAYELKRKKDADMFLTDLLISQFSSVLGGLDAIEDPKVLSDELKENTILKKDLEKAISYISPYIPLVGIISGAAVTGKHIYQHKSSDDVTTEKTLCD